MKKLAILLMAAAMLVGGMGNAQAIDFNVKGQWIMSFEYGQNGNFTGGNGRTGYNSDQDEFEAENSEDFMATGKGEYIVNGSMALFDLEEALPKIGEIESDGGITTIGGYITDRLGHMPECNEQIRVKDYIFTVTGTDGRRVNQLRVQYDPLEADSDEDESTVPADPHACPLR